MLPLPTSSTKGEKKEKKKYLCFAVLLLCCCSCCAGTLGAPRATVFDDLTINSPANKAPAYEFDVPSLNGSFTGSQLGISASGVGDFNGDRFPDFALGAHEASFGFPYSGAIFVIWGLPDGHRYGHDVPSPVSLSSLPDISKGLLIYGRNHYSMGSKISAGDLNNDGISDLIVSTSGDSMATPKGVFVIFGHLQADLPASGLLALSDVLSDPVKGGFTILKDYNDGSSSYWGMEPVRCIGDYDGDGLNDILFGEAPAPNGGNAYLIYGKGQHWPSLVNLSSFDGVTFSVASQKPGAGLGTDVTALDLNLDAKIDLVITATRNGNNQEGEIDVIWGRGTGRVLPSHMALPVTSTQEGFYIAGPKSRSSIGWVVTTGDINGDGYLDLIYYTADSDNSANVVVVFASASTKWGLGMTTIENSITLKDTIDSDGFGRALASGDFDEDGHDDVIISAIQEDDNYGKVYIFYGSSAPSSHTVSSSSSPDGTVWSLIRRKTRYGDFGISVGFVKNGGVLVGAYGEAGNDGTAFLVTAGPGPNHYGLILALVLGALAAASVAVVAVIAVVAIVAWRKKKQTAINTDNQSLLPH